MNQNDTEMDDTRLEKIVSVKSDILTAHVKYSEIDFPGYFNKVAIGLSVIENIKKYTFECCKYLKK